MVRGEVNLLHVLPRPPSYRQRALVEIAALIAQAEMSLARHPAETGEAKTRDRLQREQRRLALFYRSRQFLCSDEFSAVKARRRH